MADYVAAKGLQSAAASTNGLGNSTFPEFRWHHVVHIKVLAGNQCPGDKNSGHLDFDCDVRREHGHALPSIFEGDTCKPVQNTIDGDLEIARFERQVQRQFERVKCIDLVEDQIRRQLPEPTTVLEGGVEGETAARPVRLLPSVDHVEDPLGVGR
ncbi:MAG: hypothetical protein OES24_14085 [Acidimicrobiia bacterium]|nr:hypothetical protein [Acidimicrobiia bacterium]